MFECISQGSIYSVFMQNMNRRDISVYAFPAWRVRRLEEAQCLLALLDLRRVALLAFFPVAPSTVGSAYARLPSLSSLS